MTGFSRRPEEVDAARQFLIACRSRPDDELPTYGEVAASYGGVARAVGPVLNTIWRDCSARGEPDLTVLVVDKSTHLPGTFDGQQVDPGSRAETRWRDELRKVRQYDWS